MPPGGGGNDALYILVAIGILVIEGMVLRKVL